MFVLNLYALIAGHCYAEANLLAKQRLNGYERKDVAMTSTISINMRSNILFSEAREMKCRGLAFALSTIQLQFRPPPPGAVCQHDAHMTLSRQFAACSPGAARA